MNGAGPNFEEARRGRPGERQAPGRPVLVGEAGSPIAWETAETLARLCTLGAFSYPVILLTAVLVTTGAGRPPSFVVPCGLLQLLVAGARLAAILPFEARYRLDPRRWRRNFRLGSYCSALVWVVFALEEMNANGSAWPTWMILLMTAGIAAGATTSLCPDPPLLNRFLPLLLGPLLFWGLVQGGSCGNAVAIATAVYLVFICAQARHNSEAFYQSAVDKQALREARRRREVLVDSIDGIVWEAEPRSRRFLFVSRRAEAILGHPTERWLGEPSFWQDHVHPDDRARAVSYANSETAAGRDFTMEYRMLAADGHVAWVRDIVSIGKEGSEVVVLRGVMFDVTAHKVAADQRSMLADALCTVREAVSISDAQNRILFVNDSFVDLYGYRREEVLSGDIHMVRSTRNPPELDATIAQGTNRGGWQGEVWNRRKDGSEFPISLSTSLVRDEFGHTIAHVGVATDITARKSVEDEWQRAREGAEAASRAKSEFLANMSHEIRTPMNGIVGMAGLLLDGELDPRQRKRAETVRDSAEALLGILNDILDLSKMEANKLKLADAPFDLRNLVEGVADLMAVKAQEKGVELLCLIEQDVPTQLCGDASRLRQVLVNLAGNAVKFTSRGEVSIRAKLADPSHPARIRFEVKDTGVGIPADKCHLLFQPFSQVDSSTSRRYRGTGLGLSIVRMLVDIMGGEVGFESEEGKGSHFWFTVPMERQSGVGPRHTLSLAGWRILVVDDHAASRGLIMELLTFWKASAEEVSGAPAALDLLRSVNGHAFDAVVVDLDTLGSRSHQFLALLREHPQTAGTPVVVMVPLSLVAEGERWRRLGFAGHVGKPVKQGELGTCLASILGYGPAPARPGEPKESRTDRGIRARLLVVEDNRINQEVALGILENLGYRADVVADGYEALAALSRQDYDVVLMDCQLPGIDGYETSRRIRQLDTAVRNHDIPIIAATANAMTGDREKCLAAGMDGYVSKPLRPDALERAIEEWTGGLRDGVEPAAPQPLAATVTTAAAFDRESFVERVMGNEELACRIIRGFVDDMPVQIARLAEAVSAGDAQQVRMLAHSIKGAAASVDGLEMREAAWMLEQKGSSGDLTDAPAALPVLAASFERVKPVMERFCREDPAGADEPET